jgi:hypothetical protein
VGTVTEVLRYVAIYVLVVVLLAWVFARGSWRHRQ